MIDLQMIQDILHEIGWVPSLLILGGYFYAFLLLFVLLYHFGRFIFGRVFSSSKIKKK